MKALDAHALEALIAAGGVDVVDVRDAREFATGHVPGARLVPLDSLRADPAAAALKDGVIFVCAKGMRSITAAKIAEDRGIKDVASLDGGTFAWAKAGLPLVVPEAPARPASSAATSATPEPAQDPAEADPALDALVSANLRELRTKRGLSLDVLAGQSGVSRSLLGQIELGRAVPSIGVIWKIAQALEVHFSTLLSSHAPVGTTFLQRARAKRLTSADGRFSSRALFNFGDARKDEFYELWLAPHGREDADAHRPGTRESLVVASGKLDLTVGSEKFTLERGDAIVFAADVQHSYANPIGEECWMYLVMTYAEPVTS